VTRIPEILGSGYDLPALLPRGLSHYSKRDTALAALKRAEADGDGETARLLTWELGILDLVLAPADGTSPYRNAPYDKYAEFYRFTDATARYASERAGETQDLILKLHYLEFVSLQSPKQGLAWLEQQREQLRAYRQYIDESIASTTPESEHLGVHVERALTAIGRLLSRGGVVPKTEAASWAEWIVSLAEQSRRFPVHDPQWIDQQKHRWVADYLTHLGDLPADSIEQGLRARTLQLLEEAATYYQNTPLNDHFAIAVAEADASIRKHFGEKDTHERMIRAQVAALENRAKFHQENGQHALSIAHFQREALSLVMTHRQYFTDEDVNRLARSEQAALKQAVDNGEFATISVPISMPVEAMDFTGDTAKATLENIVRESIASVPRHAELEADAKGLSAEAPLQSMIGRTVVGRGKVVGESQAGEGNLALDVEQRALLMARMFGAALAHTIVVGRDKVQLSAHDLASPFEGLPLEKGTVDLLTHGLERLLADDFLSAAHMLVPRIEDILRQVLTARGVNTTTFKRSHGRTDDATLGTLLSSSFADGTTVRSWLGEDLWHYLDAVYASQTGLNLRHIFAHGLARPEHCAPDIVGVVLSILYILSCAVDATAAAAGN
jgi:hypothetical protein